MGKKVTWIIYVWVSPRYMIQGRQWQSNQTILRRCENGVDSDFKDKILREYIPYNSCI